MSENRLKVFSDEEILTMYQVFYDCDTVPCGLHKTFNKLLKEFGDENIIRIGRKNRWN